MSPVIVTNARLTEIKTIDVWQDCIDSPVFLCWFLAGGGVAYWCFGTRQQRGITTKETGTYTPFIDDLENAEADIERMGISVQPQLALAADSLTTEQMQLIETLISSTRVLMLLNNDTWQTEGCKWQTVRVNAGSYKTISTDQPLHSIEVIINLAQLNQQAQ